MGAVCCSEDPTSKKVEMAQDAPALEQPGFAITFRKDASPDSEKRVVKFVKGPLGMTFNQKRMPIVVKDTAEGGAARGLGVQQGMVIEKIGDEDVTEVTYEHAYTVLRSNVDKLPKD
mmetsp:Transcript_24603/g.47942  ORF Transcript_24603/g.47942 Transcript_24603/m.47942 type:complete len:117 (+) Transcript_24603:56-406(+)